MRGSMSGFRGWVAVPLMAAMLGVLPSAGGAAPKQSTLKFALMVPRSPRLALQLKKFNRDLLEQTGGLTKLRVYFGGAAGDERTVLRKMKSRQIDGTAFALPIISNFVREALVLESPALFMNYKQVDAARRILTPDFNDEAYRNGFKMMVWGDVGRLRIFSKVKIKTVADLRRVRPWLYIESEVLKEFYKVIGATGIPLSIAEVYGGMQTGMIDTFWGTALIAGALQWHRTAQYVSPPMGFINGGIVFKREAWDELPEVARTTLTRMVDKETAKGQRDIRKQDRQAYAKLLDRGYTEVVPTNEQEWWDVGHKLRKRMIGRVYTKKLVDRAEQIAMKYASGEQKQRMAASR